MTVSTKDIYTALFEISTFVFSPSGAVFDLSSQKLLEGNNRTDNVLFF